MQTKTLAVMAAVGCAAAIAIPSIALGNARRDATGDLAFLKTEQTPYVTRLTGAAETPVGDIGGIGGAAVTFNITDPLSNVDGATVCWDLSYGTLAGTATASHIHRGAAGTNGPVVLPFGNITATGATGCATVGLVAGQTVGGGVLASQIVADPAGFYVNVHTTIYPGGAIRGQLAAGPPPTGEAHLLPAPLRAYDSRTADGPLALNATRTVSLATGKDAANATALAVPPGATAAIVTLTVTDTTVGVGGPGGFLKLYTAALGTPPSTSSINWTGAGQNLAVTTTVAVDAAGQVKVTDGSNPTDFVVDVIGYLF